MQDVYGNYVNGLPINGQTPPEPSGGGSGGAAQILEYVSNPNTESLVPDNQDEPAWAYAKNNDGPPYAWNTTDHVWM